jgi:arylformamidase
MKIYDISRELFSAPVYPDDPGPYLEWLQEMKNGSEFNLSKLTTGSHNATHVDAPLHFIEDGVSVERLNLDYCIGNCTVVSLEGIVTGEMIEELIPRVHKRLLIKGGAVLHESAAFVLGDSGFKLVGVESMTVGAMDAPRQAHLELLSKGTVILESLSLSAVPEGNYFLFAPPLKIKGAEGSPCRAVLLEGFMMA